MPTYSLRFSDWFHKPALSYWLALISAMVSFAIVLDSLLFPAVTGLLGLIFHMLSNGDTTDESGQESFLSNENSRSRLVINVARSLFVFTSYFFVLQSFWSDSLLSFYGVPLLLIIAVSLLAAANQSSYGGSRGFTSIAAIAFLLFARNALTMYEFEAPFADLAKAAAFVAFIEIAVSDRFRNSQDKPHPELLFGLLLAVLASFTFTSLALAFALSSLPIASFLVSNHRLARYSNEHTEPAFIRQLPLPEQKYRFSQYALLILGPLFISLVLYLSFLRVPSWTQFLPEDPPHLAETVAERVKLVSNASSLDESPARELSDSISRKARELSTEANQAVAAWTRKDPEAIDESQSEAPSSTPDPLPRRNSEVSSNPYREQTPQPTRGRSSTKPKITVSKETIPFDNGLDYETSPFQRTTTSNSDTITDPDPPRATLGNGPTLSGGQAGLDAFEFNETQDSPPPNQSLGQASGPVDTPESATLEFDRFLESFDNPGKAIAETLNLEGSDVSALLNEQPFATVTLESGSNAPKRLYLRRQVMDTVSSLGISSFPERDQKIEIDTSENRVVETTAFQRSQENGTSVIITASLRKSPSLPLPSSFSGIQAFNTNSLSTYPLKRVIIAPAREEPVTYRLLGADLEVSSRNQIESTDSDAYLRKMLEVPLSNADRRYLKSLAQRVGGSKSSPSRFANRFANYFSKNHTYSYFVEIPPGPEHAVVRWLRNDSPGLCSNYAAAFTLLARSRGIPTRVVGGFASVEFDASERRYVMRQNHAHAWVEYLNQSNQWIQFDPTPSITGAELRRAQSYVTPAAPASLDQLLANESRNLTGDEPGSPNISDSLIAAAIREQPETASPRSEPTPAQPNEPARTETPNQPLPSRETNGPPPSGPSQDLSQAPENQPKPPVAASSQESTPREPEPEAIDKKESVPTGTASRLEIPTPSREVPATKDQNTPWLLTLAVLALATPLFFFLMNKKTDTPRPPEIRLRHQAGQLLAKLETLIQEHKLESDAVWTEIKDLLHAQRYGREPNAVLIKDISVKVALLEKKKN